MQDTLTARQLECVALLARGNSRAEIAEALFIARTTVDYHLRVAYRLLGVSTAVAAVAEARRRELIGN